MRQPFKVPDPSTVTMRYSALLEQHSPTSGENGHSCEKKTTADVSLASVSLLLMHPLLIDNMDGMDGAR